MVPVREEMNPYDTICLDKYNLGVTTGNIKDTVK